MILMYIGVPQEGIVGYSVGISEESKRKSLRSKVGCIRQIYVMMLVMISERRRPSEEEYLT